MLFLNEDKTFINNYYQIYYMNFFFILQYTEIL